MAFNRVPERSDEVFLVQKREHLLGFGDRDQLQVHAKIAPLGLGKTQESIRSGVSASMTPPVRCRLQDWPEISSSSL